jgi:hypothetical protein
MSTNADSLLNKRKELQVYVYEESPDIIAITEIIPKNMRDPIEKAEITLSGYELFSNLENRAERGVALWIKKSLKPVDSEFMPDAVESVWAEIPLCRNDRILVGCVYRSPSATPQNDLKINNLMTKVGETRHTHKLVMGDFNHPEIDWKNETTKGSLDHPSYKFIEAIRDSFLVQHVLEPTHQRNEEENANTLDLLFTNESNMIESLRYLEPLGKSHHRKIQFKFQGYSDNKSVKTTKFAYNKGDYSKLREEMTQKEWPVHEDIEETWKGISENIRNATSACVPKVTVKSEDQDSAEKPPWYTPKVREKCKAKRKAYEHFKDTGRDYNLYARARNQAQWEVRKAVREDEKETANRVKNNPKALFSHANKKIKTKSTVSDLKLPEGGTTSTGNEKVETLATFFESVYTVENTENLPIFESKNPSKPLNEINVTGEMVLNKLKKLNPNKSSGPDGIHTRVLKEASNELAQPLADLFNQSLKNHQIPTDWKLAEVTPIYKKGSKSEPGNYRPVSLTSTVCKVMESIIRDKVMAHMEQFISAHQHGFQSGRSCVTQLLETLDQWTRILSVEKTPIDAIYLDFAKAFDKVPHKRLLKKLEAYGIAGDVLGWIEDFLSNRKQRVVVGEDKSRWCDVTSGVPQGSVLGPALFICYVNDMPDMVKGMIKMFADDTKIAAPIETEADREALQSDLDDLQKWTDDWQLQFNTKKCKVMHLGHGNSRHQYTMAGNVLEVTECEKDLGVYVDPSLHFSQHCQKAAKKANSMLGLIRRSFSYLDREMVHQLYKGLVRPHLEYANAAWSPQYKKDVNTLENVQRRATRLVPELRNLEYEDRLKALNLHSLVYRRRRGDLIEVFKYKNGMYKDKDGSTNELLPPKGYDATRGNVHKLEKQEGRLELRKNFFSLRVHDAWNHLPNSIASAPSLDSFKRRLDRFADSIKFSTEFPLPVVGKAAKGTHIESDEEEEQDN